MRLFEAKPDDANWGKDFKYHINATHMWRLPGLICQACGATWATTGLAYPAVDLSGLPTVACYSDPGTTAQKVFERLRFEMLHLMPAGSEAPPPGTEFGPLLGRAHGKFRSFAWVNSWTLLAKKETVALLESSGLRLPVAVETKLVFHSNAPAELVELQIQPLAKLARRSFAPDDKPACASCGRDSRRVEHVVLDRASIPSSLDLFRVQNYPTLIFASQQFMKAVQGATLTDIIFSEVETSGEAASFTGGA